MSHAAAYHVYPKTKCSPEHRWFIRPTIWRAMTQATRDAVDIRRKKEIPFKIRVDVTPPSIG